MAAKNIFSYTSSCICSILSLKWSSGNRFTTRTKYILLGFQDTWETLGHLQRQDKKAHGFATASCGLASVMILLVAKHTCPKGKKTQNPPFRIFFLIQHKSNCITILQSFTQWQFCCLIDINKFYPYSSDQSVPIADWWEWLKSFISFRYGSVIIVTKVCNMKPFDLTINNSTFCELDFLLNGHVAISHHLQSGLLWYPNSFCLLLLRVTCI